MIVPALYLNGRIGNGKNRRLDMGVVCCARMLSLLMLNLARHTPSFIYLSKHCSLHRPSQDRKSPFFNQNHL